MLVIMASLDGSTPVETFLAVIHLEKYVDTFSRAGLLLARDFTHLDHDALVSLGITATGHRKRILRLVSHIQRTNEKTAKDSQRANKNPRADRLLDRCQSVSDSHSSNPRETKNLSNQTVTPINFQPFRNRSAPNLAAMLTNSTLTEGKSNSVVKAVVKPVPKPRTVFNRRRTAPVHFTPDPLPQPPRRLSQDSLCFTILESLNSREAPAANDLASSPTDGVTSTLHHRQFQSRVERQLSHNSTVSDSGGGFPPVPPRLNHGSPPAIFQRSPPSSSPGGMDQSHASSPSSSPSSPFSSLDNTRFSGSSPSCSPRSHSMEMVSNEIYCGTLPGSSASSGGRTHCNLQTVPLPPPRQVLDRTPERNSGSTLSDPSSGSTRVSTDDPEEEISPYCETVFQTRWQPQPCQNDRGKDEGRVKQREEEKHADGHGLHKLSWAKRLSQALHSSDSQGYSTVGEPAPPPRYLSLPPHLYPSDVDEDLTISPYASYTSLSERAPPIIFGWLDKLSPQGNYVFQKRYVKFDGKNLMYFGSEKDAYPKGVIPLAAIQMARPAKDNKFEIVTNHRIFVFRADNEVLRHRWVSTLQERVKEQLVFGRPRFGPGTHCQKHGHLELKGTKSKVYAAINTEQIWLYKGEQCFRNGIGITVIEARGATIRDGKHKSFDLITPYKTFSFTAESEREKRDWMEALQESIAETLSDYEVAEKIWSNRSNKICADCKAINPDWASINLCVVICKNCAGQHRGLGTMVSKVQSLKLDTSVWSNEIVQLFIMLGNDRANDFWAARLSVSEELDCDAMPEQRREFITQKYKEGRYRNPHPSFRSQEELLKVLCTAVTEQNLLKTVTQIFAEAEACRLADSNGYEKRSSLGFCSQSNSDPSVYDEIMQPVLHSGYLYKSGSLNKGTLSRKTREDFQKYWCTVDKSLLFYESDHCPEPCMQIGVKDILCLGVSRPDTSNSNNGFIDRFRYTFELYLTSDKLYQFGLETPEALHSWTKAIGKAATPLSCHCLLTREFERVGVLRYKAMLDPQQWKEAYFVLQKSNLFICPGSDGAAEDIINLNRLQELSTASENDNHEKKDILVLVEKGRTLHLQGMGRTDFSLWFSDIQRAAGGKGNTLRDQQLSRNDIPIIVDSCIAFITQYGLGHEGIYRKNGAKSRIKLLMEEFRKDARNVKLRIGDNFIEDVTDVLKRFFREIDDPIFMGDLHPLWREAAKFPQKKQRLDRYKEIIRSLPRVNRTTLAALISHLYRVQKCADLNQMCTKNLSLLFAPSLFQTDGKGEHEVKIVEDLIDNYLYVFDIDEEHQTQIDLEISLITTWKDTQLSQAGDLIIEVYLEMKIPDCCITLKVSPTMCAEELTNQVLYMRNIPAGDKDVWMTFEAIEDGQLERPLHPKEKVLEQALQWCKMADPSSAYLVVKKVPKGEGINILTSYKSEIMKIGLLRCREEPPKLLQGNKFQERSFQIKDHKLLLLKDKKSIKPEKEWALKSMKVYIGIRQKLKAPTRWGFTVMSDKHQLFLCCASEADLWDWITCFLKAQNDNPCPPVLRRHSSADISKQKFGTMPLVPIRGNESNSTMLSANKTLRKLHDRRTLSMFFPMKVQQDSFEERSESPDSADLPEPLYEEVGDFGLQVLKSLETSFLSSGTAETREVMACPLRTSSLDRAIGPNPVRTIGTGGSLDTLVQSGSSSGGDGEPESGSPDTSPLRPQLQTLSRRGQHPGVCTPSQELLLQELSSVFTKKPEKEMQVEEEEEEVEEERPYDV
ncbi:arf-GAP with Rho-GAP domain, ANK repeat and PH domain-containing protein 3 isoform X2 [Lampris incognitus]|uniref:arf-GAP with Rho-GAP domain, ANK repeat and PH domain-containing protein 3 isoform X2 n=1 Tax=Lampris incognitus TaxID=2546036 RepID=UPI0024B6133B|nr:arf-GAP with Rho-GAP domain, ANK repeat and PH domain-containing protein 3 isoform X2 [Lampris incognitus]